MRTVVQWDSWEGNGVDHCSFLNSADSFVIEGVVIGSRSEGYAAHYYVLADCDFCTREVRVEFVGGPRLHLTADGKGNWFDVISAHPVPLLAGCLDVDIAATPATNTLPIKRLAMKEQATHDILVAYIPLATGNECDVFPRVMAQNYTCLIPGKRYRYESTPNGFTAELQVDPCDVVLDYPEMFRRRQAR
jgi:hypothetical protein